jgi:putative transposase
MEVLEQMPSDLPVAAACRALGASRASLYRATTPPTPPPPSAPRRSPRKLSAGEIERVRDTLHEERFVDQPPAEVYGTLLSEGVYVCAVRTMYRLLASWGESKARRGQRASRSHAKPELVATARNQVWTWDITKLAGPTAGVFYYAYVMIDLFSRYVVGWLLAEKENAKLATQFIGDTIRLHGVDPDTLTLHNDRGAPMTSGTMATLCSILGVEQSFSRPRVSNDNPHSESHFKTLKYQPDYPGRFGSASHARAWLEQFFGWYNEAHHHEGLALFTPADVFFARVAEVAARRQVALDTAYEAHPERFVQGRPAVRLPPAAITINVPIPVGNTSSRGAEGDAVIPEGNTVVVPSANTIPSSEPPPEASLRPSPAP